ncbi:MAG: molybdopterin molybdotransferase MoeA [Zoogloeaceae bacterium]|nr:molybdopterin molybdotransferase MoeA [Rhodocyclaceae bacterium]MCP5234500.1 molybdopterin molybdotransferase MoeA [Zoogloeaceae bacterium]
MKLPMLSFEEALSRLESAAVAPRTTETLDLAAAHGRVLAQDLRSGLFVPPHDNSGMDGYAVRRADVIAPGTRLPVSQRIPAGSVGTRLAAGSAARIFTGAPIPAGADAVVMQEDCDADGDGVVIRRLPAAGDFIRHKGDDIRAGDVVLAAGTRLGPAEIGQAASIGVARVPVFRRLRVAVLSTGDELTEPGEPLPPGGIYNSNRFMLRAAIERLGCAVSDGGIVADTLESTRRALRQAAAGHDLIVTSGGVSMGEEDHVKPAVEAEGELTMWKIAVKPGKPLSFGRVGDAAFVGLPGNPVSALVTFLILVRPYVLRCCGVGEVAPGMLRLPAGFDWKTGPRREFLRVRVAGDGRLERFANQESSVLTSCVWADGLASVPPETQVAVGDPLSYVSFSDLLG